MRPLIVVVIDPVGDFIVRLVESHEIMLPRTFFLEAPIKSLDHAVLFRRVGRYILLMKMIFRHRLVKPLGAKHESVVGSDHKAMHIRNDLLPDQGILNAPATGEAMAELILDGAERSVDLSPFNPARLAALDPDRVSITRRLGR